MQKQHDPRMRARAGQTVLKAGKHSEQFDPTPSHKILQVVRLRRRFRIGIALASVIAEHAFNTRAAA